MAKWLVDDGQSQETFEAENADEAREKGEDWLREGEWGDDGCVVTATVRSVDDSQWGETRFGIEVTIDADQESLDPYHSDHIGSGHEHEWQSPYSVVGGCKENPGVWASLSVASLGSGVAILEVCQCGARRHSRSNEPVVEIDYPWGLWPDGSHDFVASLSVASLSVPSWFQKEV